MAPAAIGDVAEALGDAAVLAARYDVAATAYRDARRRVGEDPLRLAELYRKEGRLRERSLGLAQSKRWYTRAVRALEAEPGPTADALRAKIDCARGGAELRQGRLRACVPLLQQAVARAGTAGDRATLAHAYYLLDAALTDLGSSEADRYRHLALPIFEELGDQIGQGNVLNNLGVDAYYEGDWERAVKLYERSRDAFERGGDVVQVASALNNIAEIRSDQGRLDEAQAAYHRARRMWDTGPVPAGLALVHSNLGRLASRRRGEFDEAAEPLADAQARFQHIGAEAFQLEVRCRRAELHVLRGDPETAPALLTDLHQTWR